MSKQTEISQKTEELANRLENGERNKALIDEFTAKWGCNERTVDNYIALARQIIAARLKSNLSPDELNGKITVSEIQENLHLSFLERMGRISLMGKGIYQTEELVYTKGEPKMVMRTPTFTQQMTALKESKKYDKEFNRLTKNHPEMFEKLREITERVQNENNYPHPL